MGAEVSRGVDFSNVPEGKVGGPDGQSLLGLGLDTGRMKKSGLKALFPQT